MKQATGNSLLRAWDQAVKKIDDDKDVMSIEVDAGFIIPAGQKKGDSIGVQVFVKVVRYSDRLLKMKPESGGLWTYQVKEK